MRLSPRAMAMSWAIFLSSATLLDEQRPILQPSLVEKVNSNPHSKWKADMNWRFANSTVEDFKRLLGAIMDDGQEKKHVRSHPRGLKLPLSFDSRDAWPQCTSLRTILDQGHCGSCWAFGAVESLSDRFCIHFNESVILSENDLLSCCGFECGMGCGGGMPLSAWWYLVRNGVVTTECLPYFDSKGCQHPGCEPLYPTPECVQQCTDNSDWNSAKYFAANAYNLGSDPYDIMAEVYTNGPVEVAFNVYEDFAHYKSGVYHYVYGDFLGGHAVKLIGWGTTDEGVDYWILANSWNQQWGQDGYFWIERGVNECGIESNAVAGMPAGRIQLADQ
ncbi:hypothetical protein KP509_03G080900 [Ceratopteris richardii]|uniref:Peptidase C1A papain C-terminal domain-containing protein n=1 Tax=Ceratopteris richardii TaxID=49495 RepID=A0A8T2V5H6_CERRI|nr:hypothetical protein KP509_03G080900 [Ceratopteris richardii]